MLLAASPLGRRFAILRATSRPLPLRVCARQPNLRTELGPEFRTSWRLPGTIRFPGSDRDPDQEASFVVPRYCLEYAMWIVVLHWKVLRDRMLLLLGYDMIGRSSGRSGHWETSIVPKIMATYGNDRRPRGR